MDVPRSAWQTLAYADLNVICEILRLFMSTITWKVYE